MKKIEDMTLREKIGQLMMCGFPGTDLEGIIDLIENYKIGNVILFAHNIKNAKELFQMTQRLQKVALEKLGHPLFIGIDQEGGMVTRIFHGATFFPGNMTIGATGDAQNAYRIGQMMGKELYHLGINLNLAPVLDVNNNPKNPVIGVRSYSDSPEEVATFGTAFMKGLQENRVLATGKHFPGHGDTSVDSHKDLSSVDHDITRLDEVELYPFKQAIENGISAIMTAHVLFPAYEPDNLPATLSKKVLTDLLRKKLQFDGIIMTDCMEMKAIDNYYSTEEAAVMALDAGVDLLTVSHTRKRQLGVLEAIERAIEEGRLSEETIDKHLERILRYKSTIEKDVQEFLHKSWDDVKGIINHPEHRNFAQSIADQGLTRVKGKAFEDATKRTLFLAPRPKALTIADDAVGEKGLLEEITRHFPEWVVQEIALEPTEEQIRLILKDAQTVEQVVLCTYNANIFHEQRVLLEQLQQSNVELYVVALRNPYDLMDVDVNGLCTFEYTSLTIHSLIRYFKGELKPTGQSPVKLT